MALSDQQIIAIIEEEESKAYGLNDSALSSDRAKALNYYNGEPFGNEIEGRSQVVSRDVLDVVESALPQVLKVFVSGDEVVKFQPKNMNDVKAAEQESDYINHIVMQKNPGFHIFYTWFKDALISKNGYVKVYYEEKEETDKEQYQGLTDDQFTMLAKDENVTILEHTAYPDQMAEEQKQRMIFELQQAAQQDKNAAQRLNQISSMPQAMLHDVKIEVQNKNDCIEICNIAPEDIMVSTDCREVSVQCARFVQHRAMMSRDEIEEQGWDVPEGVNFSSDNLAWEESNSRNLYDETGNNPLTGQLLVKDTYLMVDGQRKRYVVCEGHVLHSEDAEIVPIATITPHVMPHRHVGMSYADLCEDIQLIKSSVIRGQLDNIALSNNGRYAISDKVNLSDMLTSRPGGVVRVEGDPGMNIMPLSHTPFPPTSFTMIEYLDSIKEKRTGITAYNQGLDADSLNKTATGVSQIMNASMQRIELVARTFAETGVKELFMLVHRLVRMHYTKPDIVRLRDEWVNVDPRVWKNRNDMVISVGLGTGNKDQQLQHLGTLYQIQMAALQAQLPIVTPDNIYNTVRQLAMNAGFKQAEQFVTDPKKIPPRPPQEPPLVTVEKMKLQAKGQEIQMQAQMDQQKSAAEMQQEQQKASQDIQLEREKMQAEIALEQWKAQLEAEIQLEKAKIDASAKVSMETVRAQNQPAPASVSVLNDPNGDFGNQLRTTLSGTLNESIGTTLAQMLQRSEENQTRMLEAIVASLNRPKQIVRDQNGRALGVQ